MDLCVTGVELPLPIKDYRLGIIKKIKENQIIFLKSETGSGKTTQVPQWCLESRSRDSQQAVVCVQPRRLATIAVANRVAQERGVELGQEVGYCVRFDHCFSRKTQLFYKTEGILVREAITDPLFMKYSIILADEAHRRTKNLDLLLSLLKSASKKRPDLKVIVMSASLPINTLMNFFGNPNIIEIPGRAFPVEIVYASRPVQNVIAQAISIVITIHLNHPDGDILVFMTGKEEIEETCTRIKFELGRYKETSNVLILPLYSALPAESHSRIFEKFSPPASCDKIARKIIVSTNIAETSLTIDGVAYVVDTGFCKQKIFNPKLGSEVLASVPISKSAAIQRAGRAGRTRAGTCFRLYTEASFELLAEMDHPEIQISELSSLVLFLKTIKRNVAEFDFIHTPPPYSLMLALQVLTLIKAIDTQGKLTETGKKLSTFPLEPQLSAILLKSCSLNCQKEITKIIAMLCTDVMCFVTPFDSKKEAEACRSTYMSPDGDHLTLLNVFDDFIANGMDQQWCYSHFINYAALSKAYKIYCQLDRIALNFKSCSTSNEKATIESIRSALTGAVTRIAYLGEDGFYYVRHNRLPLQIDLKTSLRGKPNCLVFQSIVEMPKKRVLRTVTKIYD